MNKKLADILDHDGDLNGYLNEVDLMKFREDLEEYVEDRINDYMSS